MEEIKSKEERQKKKAERQEKANWAKARRQAVQSGIVLTHRKDSHGAYVCYLNRKSQHSIP